MSGKEGDGFLDGDESDGGHTDTDSNSNTHQRGRDDDDDQNSEATRSSGGRGGGRKEDETEYFNLPASLSTARHFKGITKNKKAGEVEITVRLPAR